MAGPVNGIGAATRRIRERATAIAKLELELALVELRKKLVQVGLGISLLVGAAVLGLLMLCFLLATIAAALATVLATWLALLIVTGALALSAGLLGVIGIGLIKRGSPPVPAQAIHEARLTKETLQR